MLSRRLHLQALGNSHIRGCCADDVHWRGRTMRRWGRSAPLPRATRYHARPMATRFVVRYASTRGIHSSPDSLDAGGRQSGRTNRLGALQPVAWCQRRRANALGALRCLVSCPVLPQFKQDLSALSLLG